MTKTKLLTKPNLHGHQEQGWVWMPHAGHFVDGARCAFRLNTYVNGYIVSTIGELSIEDYVNRNTGEILPDTTIVDIGLGRKYETMVFLAKRSEFDCCPYIRANNIEIDFYACNSPGEAYQAHLEMCKKWADR